MEKLAVEYADYAPKSATLHKRALHHLIDGGSHTLRLIHPFPPRIVKASGGTIQDEDGHCILDFWQGHYANLLGHNPTEVTKRLARALDNGWGLHGGYTERTEVELAEIICRQTGMEKVRFTTSGTLASMNAILLARAYTGRDLVLKVGGGWHGGHPWALKGITCRNGFAHVESAGLSSAQEEEVVITAFNDPVILEECFQRYGDRLACFILEPLIGSGGLMPATMEYLQAAREWTQKYGVVLIFDEIISGFRFRAGDLGALYGVKPDLMTLGKAIGGGMPVAAVAGRSYIMELSGRDGRGKVRFSGGTYSSHPASMLTARTFLSYLVENEGEIYPALASIGKETRRIVIDALAAEGIYARFAGDRSKVLPDSSLHMLLFPYEKGHPLETPEEVLNPAFCDVTLSERVLQLALLLENVYIVHGLGATTTAHAPADLKTLGDAYRRVARRIKPYLV
jgi:glutamate-1-semialdehyde 2,1-aminomutase